MLEPETLVERDILDPGGAHWPQELALVVRVMETAFTKAGVPVDRATELAIAGALALGEYRGGRMLYLPRGERLRTALKHAQAWRMWRGNNIDEVMAFLGVTQIRAYAIIDEQRALHRSKLQRDMFKGDES